MKRIALFCFLFGLATLSSCEKDAIAPSGADEQLSPGSGSRNELILDSIFIYARQVYLWHNTLPSYAQFAPRTRYTTTSLLPDIELYRQELFDITQYAINPNTKTPFELPDNAWAPRYSFIQTRSAANGLLAATGAVETASMGASGSFEIGSTKIAYLALNGFPLLASLKSTLDDKFASIAQEEPHILVIDLRNNLGGYVETAAHVANLIVPSHADGKLMYSERFNSNLQNATARILQFQPYLDNAGKPVYYQGRAATMADVDYSEKANSTYFKKIGKLNAIQKIYFIVSGNTASAAELLISALKPYVPCVLVGARTYGKPVGFFPINIDRYTLYLASFSLHNAEGWGDYYTGIPPDIAVSDLGDGEQGHPTDPGIKAVLADIQDNSSAAVVRGRIKKVYNMRSTQKMATRDTAFIPIIVHPQKFKN